MKTNKYAGTQTEKNLEAAFAGESQARNKYTYFASVAKKEGMEQKFRIRSDGNVFNSILSRMKKWFSEIS